MNISDLKEILMRRHFALDMAKEDWARISGEITAEKSKIELLEKCRVLVLELGKQTQAQIQQYIEDTVTLALQSVYGQAYKFIVKFEYNKRDQLEVQFFLDKGGNLLEIRRNTTGGGVVDLVAFSLRMVVWVLDNAVESPPVMVLDEPFKNVSAKFIPAVSDVVKKVSEMLEIQFIIVTHNDTFIENADLVHHIGGT